LIVGRRLDRERYFYSTVAWEILMVPSTHASLFAALLIAASATSASAAHTVNSYTPQQFAHAKALVAQTGRRVVAVENVQDGNFFFIAIGNGAAYLVTVTSSGQVYFSDPHPMPSNSMPTS
jgi:hypothetical protein